MVVSLDFVIHANTLANIGEEASFKISSLFTKIPILCDEFRLNYQRDLTQFNTLVSTVRYCS
jgi:hypothetical protein